MNPRAQIYRQNNPKPEITEQVLIEETAYHDRQVDPRFLRNRNLPVSPDIEEKKEQEYLRDLNKWVELD